MHVTYSMSESEPSMQLMNHSIIASSIGTLIILEITNKTKSDVIM